MMVVDDEKDILRLIQSYLGKRQIDNVGFSDPVDALAHFQQNLAKYDLVLSDIRMPRMSGHEFAERINELNPNVKLILMSAFMLDSDRLRKLKEDQKVDFISKPFTLSKLGNLLDKHLGIDGNGFSVICF